MTNAHTLEKDDTDVVERDLFRINRLLRERLGRLQRTVRRLQGQNYALSTKLAELSAELEELRALRDAPPIQHTVGGLRALINAA